MTSALRSRPHFSPRPVLRNPVCVGKAFSRDASTMARSESGEDYSSEPPRPPFPVGAPGRTRTCDTRFRKPLLYPLSYGGEIASRTEGGRTAPSGRLRLLAA
jgi:hypothetical protein